MKYRLLALDLDGTLLNSQKEITPEVRKALAWAKERGVYVVLSTGRIVGEAAEFARELPCEDLMVTAGRRSPLHRMSAFCKAGICRAKSAQRRSRRCRADRCA